MTDQIKLDIIREYAKGLKKTFKDKKEDDINHSVNVIVQAISETLLRMAEGKSIMRTK